MAALVRERRRKEEEEARTSLERARKAFLQVNQGLWMEGCRLLVPGVPQASSGGAEGGEEEVAGGIAETEGELLDAVMAKVIERVKHHFLKVFRSELCHYSS